MTQRVAILRMLQRFWSMISSKYQGCTASYYETFDITKYNSIMKYVESSILFFILKLILISERLLKIFRCTDLLVF